MDSPGSSSQADAQAAEADGPRRRVRVLLPLPLAEAYDYAVPEGMALAAGDCVLVPLGSRELTGVVWGEGGGDLPDKRLKEVLARHDAPPIPEASRRFVDWVANYVMSPPGAVLRMCISTLSALNPPKPTQAYRAADGGSVAGKLTPARRRVLAVLEDGPPRLPAELAREAGCGTGVLKGMAEAGMIEAVALPARLNLPLPDWSQAGAALSPDQQAAADMLAGQVREGGYSATVLDGVTGSGKTEVYFEAIAAALEAGRQVLVLLPEIALSAQWLERFARRFGAPPAEWHSDLTGARRRLTWRAVAEGSAKVVVGARSALFLPFPGLGLIVVDEEHETAFKQEDGVIYHARDMAVVRAHLGEIPIALVSATPALETVVNADQGRYRRLHLPDRHAGATLPALETIDLRQDKPERQRFLSPTLKQAVAETLAGGEQAMLFLNRRGYAPLTLCDSCGHRLECPNCTAWLVEHRLAGRLQCHHCGYGERLPSVCPTCEAPDSFRACGPGVERIAEEVAECFPDARTIVMASDLIHGPAQAADLIRRIQEREVDLIIGTQLVAKGHHFPLLTLVGVVDADLGLSGGDLRASERTFQLLQQVSGRAGRAERPGRVLLQTHMPEHPVLGALVAGDRDGFLAQEAEAREMRLLPPFGRLAALIVSGPHAGDVDRVAQALGRTAPRGKGIDVLGPAPAPLSVLRGRHRRRLLVKADRRIALQRTIADWLTRVKVPGSVRIAVDIDPYSFL
ncbi:primosomal protein N' [Inquilinus sp. CAU 1745]|uniref:primosomal protein N' n=1 Tax=Inquilinus sp. CAU 1745 TaxID=3140369 RepID=UPI00325AEB5C